MKVRNLFAASLAAMTFFSCSNEVEELGTAGAGLAPGDALISIDLGGGKTTYSTTTAEEAIHNGHLRMFKENGTDTVALKELTFVGGKVNAKIDAGEFTSGEEVSLYLYVNAKPTLHPTESAFKDVLTNNKLTYNLTAGLPASMVSKLILQAGAIQVPSSKVKSVASRLGATAAGGPEKIADLKDYKVEISNYYEEAYLFPGGANKSPNKGENALVATLKGINTGMYKDTETINYLYPGTDVEVKVTTPNGTDTRNIKFSPESGKNYTLKITPMTPNTDGSFDWDIEIGEWEEGTVGGEADFSKPETDLEKLLVEIGGNKWMPFNTSGDLATDEATATAILAEVGVGVELSDIEKLYQYVEKSKANYEKVAGKFYTAAQAAVRTACPDGYRIANLSDYAALAGVAVPVRPGTTPKWDITTTFKDGVSLKKEAIEYHTDVNINASLAGWFWQFEEGGKKLPFIGAHYNGTSGSHTLPTNTPEGHAVWTGEQRGVQYERVAPWRDGWANNAVDHAVGTTAYVRCVKGQPKN